MKLPKTLIALAAAAALAAAPQLFAGNDHHHHHGHGGGDDAYGQTADGVGELLSVAEDGGSVVLHHEPIRELRWPAMTMELALADPDLAAGLGEGVPVRFTLRRVGETAYEIIALEAR